MHVGTGDPKTDTSRRREVFFMSEKKANIGVRFSETYPFS